MPSADSGCAESNGTAGGNVSTGIVIVWVPAVTESPEIVAPPLTPFPGAQPRNAENESAARTVPGSECGIGIGEMPARSSCSPPRRISGDASAGRSTASSSQRHAADMGS